MEDKLQEIEQQIEVVEAFSEEIEAARNRYEDASYASPEVTGSMEDRRLDKQLLGNFCLDIVYAVRRYKEADAKRRQGLAEIRAQYAQET